MDDNEKRIYELEEMICPNSNHDFILIDRKDRVLDSSIDVLITETEVCKKCNKFKETKTYM